MTYFQEAKRHKNVRGFKYGNSYSLEEVAFKLGFKTHKERILFYKTLVKHGIINNRLEPSYLSFISGYVYHRDTLYGEKIVSYVGNMMIRDLFEAYEVYPLE